MSTLPSVNHSQAQLLAFALVVIINWLIHNLAVDWSLPPEVQSALQTVIGICLVWYSSKKLNGNGNDQPPLPAPPAETTK